MTYRLHVVAALPEILPSTGRCQLPSSRRHASRDHAPSSRAPLSQCSHSVRNQKSRPRRAIVEKGYCHRSDAGQGHYGLRTSCRVAKLCDERGTIQGSEWGLVYSRDQSQRTRFLAIDLQHARSTNRPDKGLCSMSALRTKPNKYDVHRIPGPVLVQGVLPRRRQPRDWSGWLSVYYG